MFSLIALLGVAHAEPCGVVAPQLEMATAAARDLRLDDVRQHVIAARGVMTCGVPPLPEEVGRFRLLEGVVAAFDGDFDAAKRAFAAARRLAPDFWIVELEQDFRELYDAADPTNQIGSVQVMPPSLRDQVWVDGTPSRTATSAPVGLVLLQVGSVEYGTRFTTDLSVMPNETIDVKTGLDFASFEKSPLQDEASQSWARLERRFPGLSNEELKPLLEEYIAEYKPRAQVERALVPEVITAEKALEQTTHQLTYAADGLIRQRERRQSVTKPVEEPGPWIGGVAQLGAYWLNGGDPRDPDEASVGHAPSALGGLGPTASVGLELRPTRWLITRLSGGYQGVVVDTVNDSDITTPTRFHGYNIALSAGPSFGPVHVLAGATYLAGPVRASTVYVDTPDGRGASVTGWIKLLGPTAQAGVDITTVGSYALAVTGRAALLSYKQDRTWTAAELGLTLHPGR